MIIEVPLKLIDESPHLRRTRWGDMEALAASIAKNGVETPGKARVSPKDPKRYELIFAHRRFRGSQMAGRSSMPLDIVEMDTASVIAAQCRENKDREDTSPVDEGASYTLLQEAHGLSIVEIAERVNVPASTVAARMRLATMIAPLRELLDRDRMPMNAGQLLAMQEIDVQEQIAEDLARMHPVGWITKADVERVMERHVRRLDRAAFDTTATELTSAGACTTCPRNTAVQRDLYENGPGVCTLPVCFAGKTDAAWAAMEASALVRGARVLTPDEVLKTLDGLKVRPGSKFVDVDEPITIEDPLTWRELEKQLAEASKDGLGFAQEQVAFARSGDHFFELVSAPYVAEFIVQMFPERARQLRGEPDPAVVEDREEKARKKARAAVELEARRRAMVPLVEMLTKPFDVETATKVMRLCVLLVLDAVGAGVHGEVARRRELPLDEQHGREVSPREALTRAASDMDAKGLGALLAELLTIRTLTDEHNLGKVAEELLALAGVNFKKLTKSVENESRGVKERKPRKSLPVVVDGPAAGGEVS